MLYDVRVKVLLLKIVLTYSMWPIYIFCRPGAPLIYEGVLNADVSWSGLWRVNDGLCLILCLFLDDLMYFGMP